MTTPLHLEAQRLVHTGQALCEQLGHLAEAPSSAPLFLNDLLAAIGSYQSAVLACIPPVPAWYLNPDPTVVELIAEREACPLYRLGWIRGFKAGQSTDQQQVAEASRTHARFAQLPTPPDSAALIEQVRRFVASLQQRHGAGTISATATRRVA